MRVTASLSRTLATLLAFCLLAGGLAGAQEPPAATKAHALLKKDVGVWDADVTMWLAGPDGPKEEGKAVESNRMLGETWLLSEFKGQFGGIPFEGFGQFGYDPAKKAYVGSWVDSMSPRLSTMEGKYDAEAGTLTMMSQGIDPQSGKSTDQKSVSRWLDDGTRQFEMYVKTSEAGEFVKVMEIRYKRRK